VILLHEHWSDYDRSPNRTVAAFSNLREFGITSHKQKISIAGLRRRYLPNKSRGRPKIFITAETFGVVLVACPLKRYQFVN